MPRIAAPAQIDESKITDFERDGYVVLPGLLDAARVARLVELGDAAIASDRQEMRQERDNGRFNGFRNAVDLGREFTEMIAYAPALPYVLRLMGPELHLLTSHLIYKGQDPPEAGPKPRQPGWHRDFAKAKKTIPEHRMPRLDLKVAYYLNDLPTTDCGVTMFWPGSHKLRETPDIPAGEDPPGAVEPLLQAGDCVLFENRTWHAGATNRCGRIRKVLMMGYTYTWVQPSDYQTQRPEVIDWAHEMYGDIGLQLLGALPAPVGFDFSYDGQPLRDYARAHHIDRVPDLPD